MKKAKKILAAAMVLLAASSFVFTSCDPEVPENNNTEQTGGDNTSGESTDKDSGSTDETPAAKEYTVTFDKADGSESPKSTAKVKDGEKAEKPADPTKTGYTFAGWFAKDAAEAFDFESTISADTTLTAKWTVVEYTITYTLGEGETNAETNPAKYTIESDDITLAAPTGTTAKPNFVAWHNGTADGTTVTSIKKGSTGNLTLVAEFTDKTTFKVTFYNGETKLDEVNVKDGDKVAADKQGAVAVEGYDFVGWYSDAALKTAFDFTKPITAATSVYGKYTESVFYTVTIDGVDTKVKAGEKVTKPADPEKDGYTFGGWYKDEECTVTFNFDKEITEDTIIYIKWNEVDKPVVWPTEKATAIVGKTLGYNTDVQFPAELLNDAKVGAKIHFEAKQQGSETYCQIQFLTSSWGDTGITEAYYEGDTENKIDFELKAKDGSGNEFDVHRPKMDGEGKYYIVVTEELLNVKGDFYLMGNAIIEDCYVEYVGGKVEILYTDLSAGPEVELTLVSDALTTSDNKLVICYPLSVGKNAMVKDPVISIKINDEEPYEYTDDFELAKDGENDYKVKLDAFPGKSLKTGDKVVIKVVSGKISDVSVIDQITCYIADNSEHAGNGWWAELTSTDNYLMVTNSAE